MQLKFILADPIKRVTEFQRYTMSTLNKRRSRRLRKKLHVGEFQEWGFEFEAHLKKSLSPEEESSLVDRFLSEVIEPRSLALGGWITGGFVSSFGRGSASDEDRKAVKNWFSARPEIEAIRVAGLVDAWYN